MHCILRVSVLCEFIIKKIRIEFTIECTKTNNFTYFMHFHCSNILFFCYSFFIWIRRRGLRCILFGLYVYISWFWNGNVRSSMDRWSEECWWCLWKEWGKYYYLLLRIKLNGSGKKAFQNAPFEFLLKGFMLLTYYN